MRSLYKKVEKEDAINKIQVAIDSFGMMSVMNSDKKELKEIKERLQLEEYTEPVYSVSKDCGLLTGSSKICFFIKCIQKYIDLADKEIVLLDFDLTPNGAVSTNINNKITVADLIENGPTNKESWQSAYSKMVEFKNYYFYVAYVSDTSNTDSFMGMVCYAHNSDMLKVSNIIVNDNVAEEHKPYAKTIEKLYDIFKKELSGDDLKKILFIPDVLNEFVNQEKYMKDESNSKEGFSLWMSIKHLVPPVAVGAPPTIEEQIIGTPVEQIDLSPEEKASKLLESLIEKLTKLTTPIQQGGADINELMDQVISKHPELAKLKTAFANLPEDVKNKYSSQLTEVLDKVDKSNIESKDLEEINADIDTLDGIVAPPTETQTEAPTTETPTEAPTETPTTETPTTETPTTETPTTETPTTETTNVVAPTTMPTETSPTETTNVMAPTTETTEIPNTVEPTTTTPSEVDTTTVTTPPPAVELKREDLKESPLLVQPNTGESGKYIFVPKDLVEKVIDFLLNNGCEITTTQMK
jgi:hypothetical protein